MHIASPRDTLFYSLLDSFGSRRIRWRFVELRSTDALRCVPAQSDAARWLTCVVFLASCKRALTYTACCVMLRNTAVCCGEKNATWRAKLRDHATQYNAVHAVWMNLRRCSPCANKHDGTAPKYCGKITKKWENKNRLASRIHQGRLVKPCRLNIRHRRSFYKKK